MNRQQVMQEPAHAAARPTDAQGQAVPNEGGSGPEAEVPAYLQERFTALRQSQEHYRLLLENTLEGIWVLDASHHTTFVNHTMADLLGYTVAEMIGRDLADFVAEPAGGKSAEILLDLLGAKSRKWRELSLRRKQGGELWTLVAATPLQDGHGWYEVMLGVISGAREHTAALGGSLEIQDAPDHASQFVLRLASVVALPSPSAASLVATAAPEPLQAPPARMAAPAGQDKIRVLVVDDHSILREGLCRVLQGEPDIEVVATASDGLEAVELAEKLHPDVITMDVAMPRLDGIHATSMITAKLPGTQVIGLSMIDEEERQATAMRAAGAVTYLKKNGLGRDLLAAIRACGPAAKA